MIVLEVNYLDASNVARTALFCNGGDGFVTKPTDTPANTACPPYLLNAGSFTRSMFSGNAPAGAVTVGKGMLVLHNMGRALDAWADYAVDGQTITIRAGSPGDAYPSAFTTLVSGVKMERMEMDRRQVRIFLRERLSDFNKPFCTQTYGGTGGVDGPSSYAGRRKPKGYGHVFNAMPVLVDPSLLIYQMSSSYESSTLDQYVRDGGVVLTNGSAYPDQATLISTAPSAGQVRHYAAGGMFRLGSSSIYDITADRKFHDATTSVASKLIERMALDAGVSAGDIATISSLGLTAGYYSEGDDTTYLQAMQAVAEGSGLWFGWSRLNKLQVQQLTDPTGGSPVSTLTHHQIIDMARSAPPGIEVPVTKVRMRYQRNWHPLSQIAGSVSLSDRELLMKQWSECEAADGSILTRHPYAGELVVDSFSVNLTTYGSPSTEATRRLNLHKVDRAVITVGIEINTTTATFDLGDVLTLQCPDFGLSAGKKFAVVNHKLDLGAKRIQLGLWG